MNKCVVKFLIISFYILNIVTAESSELPSMILQTITEINQHDLLKTPENLACGPKNAKSRSDEINDCIVDLCGPPKKNESIFLNDENFKQYINENVKKGLDPLIPKTKAILEQFQKMSLENLTLAEKILDPLKIQSPNSAYEKNEDLQREMSLNIFSPYLSDVVDLSKPVGDRYHVKVDIDPKNSKEFNENLLKYSKSYEIFIRNDPTQFLKRGLYTSKELAVIARESLNETMKLLETEEIKIKFKDNPEGLSQLKSLSSVYDNTSDSMLAILLQLVKNIEKLLKEDTKFEVPEQKNFPICSDSKSCSVLFNEHLSKLNALAFVKQQRSLLNDSTKMDQQLKQCQALIVASLSDTSDKNKAARLLEETTSDIIQNTLPIFSSHSQKVVADYLEKNIRVRNKKLENSFSQNVKAYEDKFDKFLSGNTTDSDLAMSSLYSSLISQDTSKPFEDINSLCTLTANSNAFDAFIANDKIKMFSFKKRFAEGIWSPLDKIFISDFSCHHELKGKSVVAHELGHAINFIFSKLTVSGESAAAFKKIRQCITDNYVVSTPSQHTQKGQEYDGLHTEEDMADVFEAITYKEKRNLYSCALIATDTVKDRYVASDFILSNLDPHSSNSLRVIMEAINKDIPLPKSCERALDLVKGQLRLKKCAP